jgi:hypothetical protein
VSWIVKAGFVLVGVIMAVIVNVAVIVPMPGLMLVVLMIMPLFVAMRVLMWMIMTVVVCMTVLVIICVIVLVSVRMPVIMFAFVCHSIPFSRFEWIPLSTPSKLSHKAVFLQGIGSHVLTLDC